MSAALVESVREAVTAAQSATVHYGYREAALALESLDLPAILAALTEGEALRAQVAAGQARGVALREAGEGLLRLVNDPYDKNTWSANSEKAWNALRAALSTPTDTAALRAMLEKAAGMGMSCGYSRCCSKLEAKSDADRNEIVDRALGGS